MTFAYTVCIHGVDLTLRRCLVCRPEPEMTLLEVKEGPWTEERVATLIRLLTSIEHHVRTKR